MQAQIFFSCDLSDETLLYRKIATSYNKAAIKNNANGLFYFFISIQLFAFVVHENNGESVARYRTDSKSFR